MNGVEETLECGCIRNPSEKGKYVGSLKTLCDKHMAEVRDRGFKLPCTLTGKALHDEFIKAFEGAKLIPSQKSSNFQK